MNTATIEETFTSYLERCWILGEVKPFLLTYIRLLLLFEAELPSNARSFIFERQKQLYGQSFDNSVIENMKNHIRDELNYHLKSGGGSTREAMMNRLLFSASLDGDETDFFYLTEPMFEFSKKMGVSPIDLKKILESEFAGFLVEM